MTPGRPKKPANEKLVSYGIRIAPQARLNAMTYPLNHPKRKAIRTYLENSFKSPYQENIIKGIQ